jgi:hypothetical protein
MRSDSATLAVGSAQTIVTVPGRTNLSKAFLVFSTTANDSNPGFSSVTGQISATTPPEDPNPTTTLTFQRTTPNGRSISNGIWSSSTRTSRSSAAAR